jgi:Molybdopterin-binding domain of aldehyde dehydrogenase/Transposase IS116/IS110/IS902 family
MPGRWPRCACSAPTALPIASSIPSGTCAAACWSATPLSGRARATSRSFRALLCQHGYRVPSGSAENVIARVQGLPLPGRLLSVVAPLLAVMGPLNRQLTSSDERIEHLAVPDPRVPRLRSVPSVGPVTAAAFLAAIDDAQRFRHAHPREADLGLVRREYSSGEMQRRGPIKGRPLAPPLAPDSGRGLDPPAAPAAGGGTADLGPAHRRPPRPTGGRRRPRPSPRRHPFISVDDCGVRVSPTLVRGQVHGGIAQGVAQALFEEVVYGKDGQLLTGTLMDYAVPRAEDLPSFTTDQTVTPTPHNPMGAKGIAEAATIGSTPAVVNAVVDTLRPLGVKHLDMPLRAERVWRAIQDHRAD